MEYYNLMHKNEEVLTFSQDNNDFALLNIKNKKLVPIKSILDDSISLKDKSNDFIQNWLYNRAIPNERIEEQNLLSKLNCNTKFEMILRAKGLSLSEHYWIKNVNDNIKWEDINFFDNVLFDNNYQIYFTNNKDNEIDKYDGNKVIKGFSASTNLNGQMIKAWVVSNGKYLLLKGKTNDRRIYNEEIASEILNKLNLKHIVYNIGSVDGINHCICENYINKNTEFIPAITLLNMYEFNDNNNKLYYEHFIDLCNKMGLSNVKHNIDNMIIFDYIMANNDRHLNNYGVVRNADTLELTELFPIFDNGNILWINKNVINDNEDTECQMDNINKKWQSVLSKINDFTLLNNPYIDKIPEFVKEKYYLYNKYMNISEEFIENVAHNIKNRINYIKDYSKNLQIKGINIEYNIDSNNNKSNLTDKDIKELNWKKAMNNSEKEENTNKLKP